MCEKVNWLKRLQLLSKTLEKNGVKSDVWVELETKISGYELDFAEHDKVFEDKIAELKKDYKTASELLGKYQKENESLKKRIAELESKEAESCKKEPISDDRRPSMEWYDNRHQSDCIEINRLNTTIDVLIHKVEYLRQFAGLE